jgi:putative DNA primase/helicase
MTDATGQNDHGKSGSGRSKGRTSGKRTRANGQTAAGNGQDHAQPHGASPGTPGARTDIPDPEAEARGPEPPADPNDVLREQIERYRDGADFPGITWVRGKLADILDQAERHLIENGAPIYQRGCTLVRPGTWEMRASKNRMTTVAGLVTQTSTGVRNMLARHTLWQKWDAKKREMVRIDPPPDVAQTMLAREGNWQLPAVVGVITVPTLRPDGSLLADPGYDEQTRLYLEPDPYLVLPKLPEMPSRSDAEAAVRELASLLDEFPFAGPVDRSVALSGLITPVVRGALDTAPLHAISATTAGTGKSYLVDIAAAIAIGRPCAALSLSRNEEEMEKRLGAMLLEGHSMISIDNVNGVLRGDLLCQAVERPIVRVRKLGFSQMFDIESRASWFCTGNNLLIAGDLTRRTLRCFLNAEMERPELREFRRNPVAMVLSDRGRYVAACLLPVRAYLAAGCPDTPLPLPSYGDWSDLVRGALIWLGYKDPVASMEDLAKLDPDREELREVLSTWHQFRAQAPVKLSELIEDTLNLSAHDPDARALSDALKGVAGNGRGGIDLHRLGQWARRNKDRIVGPYRLRQDTHGKVVKWYVQYT